MKKVICGLTLLFSSLCAHAVTWNDNINFDEIYFGPGGLDTYTFTHDITDSGFVPGQDSAMQAWLKVFIYGLGWAEIDLPDVTDDYSFIGPIYPDTVSLVGLVTLNSAGMLEVTLNRHAGLFVLTQSHLRVKGTDSSADIPEPLSLALLGFSLALFANRKRLFNN